VSKEPHVRYEVPIKVIGKVGLILDAFREQGAELHLQQIANAAQLELSTASRLVSSLVGVGLLRYDPVQRLYTPGLILLELSRAVLNRFSFREIAHREMIALSAETGWQCYLAVPDEEDDRHLIYIDAVSARSAEASEVGQRRTAHSTATGKVLLAFRGTPLPDGELEARTEFTHTDPGALAMELKEVRHNGYATSIDEEQLDFSSAAAPVLDSDGQVVAAFGVGTTDADYAKDPEKIIRSVLSKARGISSAIRLAGLNSRM
jgi:DNA-binding IclR family transcriptional regulator